MAAILKSEISCEINDIKFDHLTSNPMFNELRATLIIDVEEVTKMPVAMLPVKPEPAEEAEVVLDPSLVAVQEASLLSDFQQVLPTGNHLVGELHQFYTKQCLELETSREEAILKVKDDQMLTPLAYQRQMKHLHQDYDQQRMHLTNRVTASLQLLKLNMPSACDVSSSRSKSRQLNSRGIAIMTEWYERHIDNPYPTDEEKMAIADMGNLSLAQVKAWFANKRNRTNNTKPKKQKIQVEKKLLSICNELTGNLPRSTPGLYGEIIEQLSDIVNTSHVFSRDGGRVDRCTSSGDETE